jgi:hypothetical protein
MIAIFLIVILRKEGWYVFIGACILGTLSSILSPQMQSIRWTMYDGDTIFLVMCVFAIICIPIGIFINYKILRLKKNGVSAWSYMFGTNTKEGVGK